MPVVQLQSSVHATTALNNPIRSQSRGQKSSPVSSNQARTEQIPNVLSIVSADRGPTNPLTESCHLILALLCPGSCWPYNPKCKQIILISLEIKRRISSPPSNRYTRWGGGRSQSPLSHPRGYLHHAYRWQHMPVIHSQILITLLCGDNNERMTQQYSQSGCLFGLSAVIKTTF